MASLNTPTTGSGKRLYLDQLTTDVLDVSANSSYFNVTELEDTLTSGKNCIAINGSDSLQVGSIIQVEVLDVNKNALYIEVARTPSQYRSGVASIVAIYVYNTTPIGVGQINIVGTLSNGKTVKWNHTMPINPILQNKTPVRFYNTPTFTVVPSLDRTLYFSGSYLSTVSGTIDGSAGNPLANTNYYNFDILRNQVDYRVTRIDDSPFQFQMAGQLLTINNILAPDGTSFSAQSVIASVINDSVMQIQTPVFYPNTVSNKNVYNFNSASYTITYLNPPTASLSQAFGSVDVIYNRSIAQIQIGNIRTFCGNVYRLKIYRKSLNTGFDSECVADEILQTREEFVDSIYPDRFRNKIGYFVSQEHINGDGHFGSVDAGYWRLGGLAPGQTKLTYNSEYIVDGMYISGSNSFPNPNFEKNLVIHSYNNNSLLGTGDTSPGVYEVNSLNLQGNVNYVLSLNMYGFKADPNQTGRVDFYLIDTVSGSTQDYSVSSNFDGYGIKIGSVTFDQNVSEQNFQNQVFNFTLNKPVSGELYIIPYYGDYIVSQISIQAYQQFSFSPDIININIPFTVDVANEVFQITGELFDVDSHQIPAPNLVTIQAFDPLGLTVLNRQTTESQVPSTNAINSITADTASNAVNADNATFAVFSQTSGTSSLSLTSINAISAQNAQQSVNSTNAVEAQTALFANFAGTSNFGQFATTAEYVSFSSSYQQPANLLKLGGYYFWIATTPGSQSLRAKLGVPTSDLDGNGFVVT